MLIKEWIGQDYKISLEKNPVSSEYGDYWDFYIRYQTYGETFTIPHTEIEHRKTTIEHKHFKSLSAAMNWIRKNLKE